MSRKQTRVFNPAVQRPVDYNQKQVQAVLDKAGYVIVQPKADGIRAILLREEDGSVRAYTRNGIHITALTGTLQAATAILNHLLPDVDDLLDTEAYIPGVSFEVASGLLRRKVQHVEGVMFLAFDKLTLPELIAGMSTKQLRHRLTDTDPYIFSDAVVCRSIQEVEEAYDNFRDAGWEGAVVKDPMQRYTGGKVLGWWKMKPEITAGGTIIGIVWGTEGKANAGLPVGFQVELEDGTQCNATGISREAMEAIAAAPEAYIARAVEVSAMERTSKGNLRHPKFKRFRDAFERGVES